MWNFNGSYEPLAWSGNDPHPGPIGQSSTGVSQFFTPTGMLGYDNITNAPSALVISVMDTTCATQWCNYGVDNWNYARAENMSSLSDLLLDFNKGFYNISNTISYTVLIFSILLFHSSILHQRYLFFFLSFNTECKQNLNYN